MGSLFDASERENRIKALPLAARMRPGSISVSISHMQTPGPSAKPATYTDMDTVTTTPTIGDGETTAQSRQKNAAVAPTSPTRQSATPETSRNLRPFLSTRTHAMAVMTSMTNLNDMSAPFANAPESPDNWKSFTEYPSTEPLPSP